MRTSELSRVVDRLTSLEYIYLTMRWPDTEKKMAAWTLLFTVIGILIGALAAFGAAYWGIQRSDELAHATGQFNRARPHVYIENSTIAGTPSLPLYIGARFAENSLTIVEIPIAIRNEGEKTLKAPQLVVRVPGFLAIENDYIKAAVESVLPLDKPPIRHLVRIGNYAYYSYAFPDINPGQTIGVRELMKLEDSTLKEHFSTKTKDGVAVSGDMTINVGFPVVVSVTGEDLASTDYDVEVIGVKCSSKSELLDAFAEVAERDHHHYRDKVGWLSYLLAKLAPLSRRAVLEYPNYETKSGNGGWTLVIGRQATSTDATYQIP